MAAPDSSSVDQAKAGKRTRADRVGRFVARTQLPLLGATGLIAAGTVVVGVGAVGPVNGTKLPTRWLGLLSPGPSPWWAGPMVFGGVIGLLAVWLALVGLVRHGRSSTRRVSILAAIWATPLAVGPPVLSNDVFSYAAHGVLQLSERDPYRTAPAGLGHSPVLLAVDPRWRFVRSPYGPLATWLEHATAWLGHGDLVATVLVMRALALMSVMGIGVLAVRMMPPHFRPTAAALTVANPLLLLHGVSAVHLEVFTGVLLMAALWAVRRGNPALGVAFACLAGAIKVPAMLAVVVIIVVAARRGTDRWRSVVGCIAAAVLVWAGLSLAVPDAWGWVAGLSTPARGHTPQAPTQLAASALAVATDGFVPMRDLELVCRIVGACAAAAVVTYLLSTSIRRSVAQTIGLGLLAVAALGPVVYPWYLLWGVLCLVVVPDRRLTWRLATLCAGACLIALPGQSGVPMVAGDVLATLLIAAAFRLPRSPTRLKLDAGLSAPALDRRV